MPTDAYGLDEAVADGYLVPPLAISVPLKFQREGIKYSERSEEEQAEWDALEWNEEGRIPEEVSAGALADLAEAGFDPVFGARPLKRAIQDRIENPLSKAILKGEFGPKDVIRVDVREHELVFARA